MAKRRSWSNENDLEMLDMLSSGSTRDEVAEHFGVSKSSVTSRLYKIRLNGQYDTTPFTRKYASSYTVRTQPTDEDISEIEESKTAYGIAISASVMLNVVFLAYIFFYGVGF